MGVRYESRKLSIGDFVWIAKDRRGGSSRQRELVLPFVVERKRMDDLRSSIMDGRYKEQKQRLSRCGLPRKLYLIENTAVVTGGKEAWTGHSGNKPTAAGVKHFGPDRQALEQAISNTCIRDGFTIKRCHSPKDCVRFLAAFTRGLTAKYAGKTLHSRCLLPAVEEDWLRLPTFSDFHEYSRPDKPLRIREIFCNMLVSMKGLSPGMAWAITSKYGTPAMLNEAYRQCASESERQALLTGLVYDDRKKLPGAVSKTLCWLYNDSQLN